jgi:hypothetical protein
VHALSPRRVVAILWTIFLISLALYVYNERDGDGVQEARAYALLALAAGWSGWAMWIAAANAADQRRPL